MKYFSFFLIFVSVVFGFLYFQKDFSLQNPRSSQIEKIQIADTATQKAKEFFLAAKKQIGVVKTYDFSNGYYGNGGFPPDDTGVCTDVIWRAYRDIGQDFKAQIIAHHQKNPTLYSNFGDNNISFRRVKNIDIFLKNTQKSLMTQMIPNNEQNLETWQTGDIVIFDRLPSGLMHIGIISDIRRADGVPYMIDNHGYGTDIRITPLDWQSKIIGHYRVF
ncbi:DUF1287 domain-containing protein [Candidatus Gracilibacteria bacterium]|nr:DUF1287 domain-containing protein [Candidatus Gracilibacteria bacterium]